MVSAHVTTKDLELLSALIEAGKVRPQFDRRYPFAKSPQRSPIWNKAGPGGRWSWGWREGPVVRSSSLIGQPARAFFSVRSRLILQMNLASGQSPAVQGAGRWFDTTSAHGDTRRSDE